MDTQIFQKECNDFTTETNSLIGNKSTTTMKNYSYFKDDPYISMFEDDKQDDEQIDLMEEGEDSRESPYVEKENEHIGVTLQLPKGGELKNM